MYVDGYMLFAIYFIAVLALAVSAYALWSLEEIRQYYSRLYDKSRQGTGQRTRDLPPVYTRPRGKGHWD
jgi:hypothetical protein